MDLIKALNIVTDNELYEVVLLPVDTVTVSGNIYPKEVIEKAIRDLKLRRKLDNKLFGECAAFRRRASETITDYYTRTMSIAMDKVGISVDTNTMEIKNGFLIGKCQSAGPLGSVVEELLKNNQTQFAMRSIVQYAQDNGSQLKDRIVSHCDIVTFDIVNITS